MSLGSLVVSLAANTAQFAEDMGKAAHIAAKNMDGIRKQAEKAGKAIGALFVAGVGTASVLVKQSIDSADAMSKMAQSAGVGMKTLSELAYAADLSGVSTESLGASMNRLNRGMMETAAGTGTAQRAFDALGISVKDSDGNLKSSDQVMAEVADQFAKMEDGAAKSALAMEIFGKSGAAMIPMLNMGSQGIKELRDEAIALGVSLESEAGRAAEQFNDNLTRMNTVKKGLANTVMMQLLPTLVNLTDRMVESAKTSNILDTAARAATAGLKILMTGAAILIGVFKSLGESWGSLAAAFTLAAQGEFSKAWQVVKDGANNFNQTITDTLITVQEIWNESSESANASMQKVAKAQAPIIANEKELVKIAKEKEKQTKDAAKAQQEFDDLMAKAAMKRLQMYEEEERRANEAHEKKREMLEGSITQITDSLLTEEERERESYTRRLANLIEAYEMQIITEGEMMALREGMEEQHRKKLEDIIKRSGTDIQKWEIMTTKERAKSVLGELQNMTNGVTQQSRFMFNVNKAASLANAILKGYESIQNAYAFGSRFGGPFGGAAMAAVAAVATAAQVRAIASTQFGSSAAPSVAGTTAAPPVSPVSTEGQMGTTAGAAAPVRRDVNVYIQGSTFTRSQMEEFIESMNEVMEDGFPARFRMAT